MTSGPYAVSMEKAVFTKRVSYYRSELWLITGSGSELLKVRDGQLCVGIYDEM